jgi:hypothetical protein
VRRPSTMLASAAAAALAALAVTVATPAIGDEGPPDVDDFAACLREHGLQDAPSAARALKSWLGERLERGDAPTERAVDACAPVGIGRPPAGEVHRKVQRDVRACLVRHGAQIEGDDPAAIKRWVAEHADDPAARDALKACHIATPVVACDGKDGPPRGTPGAPPDKPTVTTETAPREL